jgi:SAM-dependent methyltransferase
MNAEPYSLLAAGYDRVMDHVDYDVWAAVVSRWLARHADDGGTASVLELGCGTAALAVRLAIVADVAVLATDNAPAMLREARARLTAWTVPVRLTEADFTALDPEALADAAGGDARFAPPYDAAVLVYDGLNYVRQPEGLRGVFDGIARTLRPGGLAVIDQVTPANSEAYDEDFFDRGTFRDARRGINVAYLRTSHYDADARLHTTTFEITTPGGQTAREEHVQQIYTMAEVRAQIDASTLSFVAAYDGFGDDPATAASHRIHWVLRR